MKKRIESDLKTISLLIFSGCILSLFSRLYFVFELFIHFSFWYLLFSVSLLVFFVFQRKHKFILCNLVSVGLSLVFIWTDMQSGGTSKLPGDLRVLYANINTLNSNYQSLENLVESEKPDIIALLEFGHSWNHHFKFRLPGYTHRLLEPINNNFGLAIYSRIEFQKAELVETGNEGLMSASIVLNIQSKKLRFLLVHPPPPIVPFLATERNKQLDSIAKIARSEKLPLVVAGDFNTTEFSPFFKDMMSKGRLKSHREWGFEKPTWLSFLPILAIDHVLSSSNVLISNFETTNSIGSDHLPLVFEVTIPGNVITE